MSGDLGIDGETFIVLVNGEGQHSLWPAAKAAPEGWSALHGPAPKADCLTYVEAHWTDMRPRHLAEAMAASSANDSEA